MTDHKIFSLRGFSFQSEFIYEVKVAVGVFKAHSTVYVALFDNDKGRKAPEEG